MMNPLPTPYSGSSVTILPRVRDRLALAGLLTALLAVTPAHAQRVVRQPEQVVSVSKGASVLVITQTPLQRFSVGDPTVAEAVVVSPTEVLVNGKALGTTTLVLWDNANAPRLYSVEVTADAPGLERYLRQLLPDEQITVSATGNSVTLSGQVRDASSANRAVEIARGSGATIVDNLSTPDAVQVLLQVRFAEVNRSAVKQFASQITTLNPHKLNSDGDWRGSSNGLIDGTTLQGALNLGLFNPNANIVALIRALTTKGDFKSLAEPNLIALPGKEASFLAGGEFPYPSVQGGGASNAVTITFKEFGIRLNFTPTITRNGSIRLKVAPEVSVARLRQRAGVRRVHHSEPDHPAGGDRGRDARRPVPRHRGADGQPARRQRVQDPGAGRYSHPGPVLPLQGGPAEPHRAAGAGDAQAGSAERRGDQAADRRARCVEVDRLHGDAQGRPQAVGTPEEVGRVNVVLPRCLAAR